MSQTIEDHYQHLVKHDLLGSRMHRKAAVELNEAIRCAVLEPVLDALVANGDLERMVGQLLKRKRTLTPCRRDRPALSQGPSVGTLSVY